MGVFATGKRTTNKKSGSTSSMLRSALGLLNFSNGSKAARGLRGSLDWHRAVARGRNLAAAVRGQPKWKASLGRQSPPVRRGVTSNKKRRTF